MKRLLALVSALLFPAAVSAGTALPVINVTPTESGYEISGEVLGTGEGEVEARLTIRRSGSGGNMSTSQGRTVSVRSGSREQIGRTTFNAGPDARLDIAMQVLTAGRLDAEATLRLGPGLDE